MKSQRLGKRGCPGELKDVRGWSRVCECVQDAVGVSGLEEALDGRGLGEPSSSQMLAHRWRSPDQPRPAASAPPGTLSEMQIPGLCPRLNMSEVLRVGPSELCFTVYSKSWHVHAKLENSF